ncbi:MAG: KdsC family phosphatase [Planctomycetaceae bacterium]
MPAPADLDSRLAQVELLLLDVDGVLTDGGVTLGPDGGESKTFHIRDGLGLRLWQRAGYRAGIVTGRTSRAVERRAAELGIDLVRQGVTDKGAAVTELAAACGLDLARTAFMGDDLPDLAALARCGVALAPADACAEVRAAAALVTGAPGGRGAVREAVERMLRARGAWEALAARCAAGRD